MKEIFKQLVTIWRDMKPPQKGASCAVVILLCVALGFVLHKSGGSSYVPLYPNKTLPSSEITEIKTYLDHSSLSYQEHKEKGLLVLSKQAEQIRLGLSQAGILKHEQGKGFELFDTNTWIKGEKELQVLEMRALKGQLENDLAAFENIKSASVILDIPPQKSFNGSKYPTKASVILTLMPKARLSATQLRAITNHLAGAVRGLEPHMIAISDTTGKLYKAIDPEAKGEVIGTLEEHLEEKISALLTKLVGSENFYTTIQALVDEKNAEIRSLSIAVVIDKEAVLAKEGAFFQKEIERQLAAIAAGFGYTVEPVVDLIPFDKKRKTGSVKKEKTSYLGFVLTLIFVLATLAALYPLFRHYKKNKSDEEESLFRLMTRIDLDKLASSVQKEDPKTIALMLSYLEPERAEQMILALDAEVQEEVLFHLSELEKEGP